MIKLTKGLSTRPLVDSFYATARTFIHSWPSDFGQFFVASSDCWSGYLSSSSCDLRSKHNMLGKSDVAQSENSLVPCRPFDIFDTV